ncbi:MAG: hypothetical protein ACKN9T_18250 [Candidatus Methylumidiphilus sp.]
MVNKMPLGVSISISILFLLEVNKMEGTTEKGVMSIASLVAEDEHKGKRTLVQVAAGALIGLGLVFTFVLNVMLYSRAFDGPMKIIGVIPAILIEGSLAVFMFGSFVWFSAGTQGMLAKIFGWLMFVIVALNVIVEFNALSNAAAAESAAIKLYSFWGVPLVIPLVIAFWKAVVDTDPAIGIMRTKRKFQQAKQAAEMQSIMLAASSDEATQALAIYGQRVGQQMIAQWSGLPMNSIDTPTIFRKPKQAGQMFPRANEIFNGVVDGQANEVKLEAAVANMATMPAGPSGPETAKPTAEVILPSKPVNADPKV